MFFFLHKQRIAPILGRPSEVNKDDLEGSPCHLVVTVQFWVDACWMFVNYDSSWDGNMSPGRFNQLAADSKGWLLPATSMIRTPLEKGMSSSSWVVASTFFKQQLDSDQWSENPHHIRTPQESQTPKHPKTLIVLNNPNICQPLIYKELVWK